MSAITHDRWLEVQKAEAPHHTGEKDRLLSIYKESYRQYFKWLGIDTDLKGKKIIEIGCANIPALYFCENYEGVIIEPMPSLILEELTKDMPVTLLKEPAEYVDLKGYDEVWLFNVLQHVIDPALLISNMKRSAKTIRYFEPVNTDICTYHPHAFTMSDFEGWFDPPNYYPATSAKNFHTHECSYGVWSRSPK